jgi:general stress protein YciG
MAGIKGEYIYDEDGNIIGATGGKLTALNNKKKHGADYYSKLGTRGAEAYRERQAQGIANPRGFEKDPDLAARAGIIGGKRSKRGKAKGGK